VTPKTKTHIYHAIVQSTITHAAETWCLKEKTKFHRNGLLVTLPGRAKLGILLLNKK